MHISRFANNPDETPLHSSGYAEVAAKDGASLTSSPAQSRVADSDRKVIGGYNRSLLGGAFSSKQYERPAARVPKRQQSGAVAKPQDRQGFNAQSRTFQEPVRRDYNPYS